MNERLICKKQNKNSCTKIQETTYTLANGKYDLLNQDRKPEARKDKQCKLVGKDYKIKRHITYLGGRDVHWRVQTDGGLYHTYRT